ncbi:hypothetical protein UlMin_003933 [Ulmus minor]
MATELVVVPLLSGFINVIFQRLAPKTDVIMKFFRGKADVVKLLEELKIKLRSVNVVLNDAEEKQLTSPDVKSWLDELTHVIYRTDFLMDKIETEAFRRKVEDESATTTSKIVNFFSTSVGAFERSVIDEGNQILERLNLLLDQKVHLGLKEGVPTISLQRVDAPFVMKESDVVGRHGDKEEIIELLLSDDTSGKNLSVIPIVGMGGIGKTTLAQLVYKDNRVQKHFDFKVWFTISEEFDVFQITKGIYEEVTSQECKTKELFMLQSKLNEALTGKRFLFVLDDVWNENYQRWDSLKSGFQSGAHGSRIIVTTRSKDVALTMSKGVMHELKLISDEDCWLVFEKHAFDDNQAPTEELQKIGLEIVERCKGLPLAVKSVAGLLRSASNPEEWRMILNSDIWQLQFQENLKNDIVPALWLSYRFLPPVLKRCFAYCSIFPKDYEFGQSDMEKIILLWMAEGLLTPENGKRMEVVGKAYLQALISRSFFQRSSTNKSAMVMHDLVHDLAMFISGEFYFSCGDSNDLSNLGPKCCHWTYRKASHDLTKLGAVAQSREKKPMSLRTLLALPLSYARVHNKPVLELHELFLKVGGCLRVFSLSESSITELPDSIGNIKYLRYLDLSHTSIKELPDSICTLYNLQTLLLSCCTQLTQLPTRLAALVNLRYLDIRGTSLKEMPLQMCKMKSLEKLSDFVLGENDGWRIKELGEFSLLEGSLCISGLEYIVDVKDALEANLKDKKFLGELILKWGGDSNISNTQQEREVLEALQPHTNLKQLRIRGYRGTIFPDWVGHEKFCHMVAVELLDCRNVCMLPPLGQLSSLRRLSIYDLKGVFSIGNEFCGSSSTTTDHPFTSLEYLNIGALVSWEEWSFSSDQLGQEGGVFPSLTELHIVGCKKLILGLPDCHLPSLKSILITGCAEMVSVFVCQSHQEMDTNAFPSLESMCVYACPKLECLPREGLLLSLSELGIYQCPLLKQRCQRGTGEDRPKIQHIPSIDI